MFGDAERIPQRKREDHTAYCFNCVLSTISFVDAVASEFVEDIYQDAERVDQGSQSLFYPDINRTFRDNIVTASSLDSRLSRASPPIKFNVLLDVMRLDEFDRTEDPLEPVVLLNRIRNELTHYSPKWVEGGPKNHTENEYGFEESLQDRFDLNPLSAPGNAFFPDQCMSFGCAEWATRNSRALVRHFGRRLNIDMRPLSQSQKSATKI